MASRECMKMFAALSEYLDGELPARNCRKLEKHLADCPPCLAYLETLRTTAAACRRYSDLESLAPPKELVARLRARILSTSSSAKPRKRRSARR
jgi:anti-sigma factor (TIGR02949 family)